MAELLFQVTNVRAGTLSGTRPIHSANEVEKYFAMDEGRRVDYASRFRILRLNLMSSLQRGSLTWRDFARQFIGVIGLVDRFLTRFRAYVTVRRTPRYKSKIPAEEI